MVKKKILWVISLYLFFTAAAFLYGAVLIKKACDYGEFDRGYSRKEIILRNGAARLVFNNGYISAYYNGKQFTEDCGLACFFSVKGSEYSTYRSLWKIEKDTLTRLTIIFTWPDLPVKQKWDILLRDGKIRWDISIESEEEITINHIGLVFFLKNDYIEWSTPFGNGKMPVLDALQQRGYAGAGSGLSAAGLNVKRKAAGLFPAIGLKLGQGVFMDEVSLLSCRDIFSKNTFSSISIGGVEPLRLSKGCRIALSSGEMSMFDKQDDLQGYLSVK